MTLSARIKKIEQGYLLKKDLFDKPWFENWSDKELTKYIKDSIERFHKTGSIKDYAGSVKYYERLFDIGEIPTKEKLKLHLQMEKEYWDGKYELNKYIRQN